MTAITVLRFDRDNTEVMRGALMDCPPEFLQAAQIRFYRDMKPGWAKCPQKYWAFAAYDAMGRKLVIPALSPSDEQRERRRFGDLGLTFTKTQIENFLSPHLIASQTVRDERDTEFRNLTHDLRAMGAEIYSTALSARILAEQKSPELVDPLDSVLAAQQMLSVRLDVVDYESGFAASRPHQRIPVYRKIDKVLKCFGSAFRKKSMSYEKLGANFARISGPPIFELIPFVIVENSIKYSPKGGKLDIIFEENSDQVNVRFSSLGPRLTHNEKNRIFDRNFRGQAAQEYQGSGSGIGLFGAKTLTEVHFGSEISAFQDDREVWVDGKKFYSTEMLLSFPILDHDNPQFRQRRLRRRSQRRSL